MPKYEYACKSCGQHLEVVQSFHDDALTECPACGGRLRKVFGAIGIAFKGSGFYRTDNRTGPAKSDGGSSTAEPKSDTKPESKTESKTESKPSDTKPGPKPEAKSA